MLNNSEIRTDTVKNFRSNLTETIREKMCTPEYKKWENPGYGPDFPGETHIYRVNNTLLI